MKGAGPQDGASVEGALAAEARLREALRGFGRVVVAYSGGVDSAYLCSVALEELGRENVIAVTAISETYPRREFESAGRIAGSLRLDQRVINTGELADERFAENPPDRCYHCKRELFGKLREIAAREGCGQVLDGTNADDALDYRPGRRAAAELGIRSPLLEVGLGKSGIRELSRRQGIPSWDRPSAACLASRFPFGRRVTAEGLKRVEAAEEALLGLGFRQVRVRDHGEIARIEVGEEELEKAVAPEIRSAASGLLKEFGYRFVVVDLEGYRTGSLNPPDRATTPIDLTPKGKAAGDAEEGSRRRAAAASTGGEPQRQDPQPSSEITP